jgi:hypothetical protein
VQGARSSTLRSMYQVELDWSHTDRPDCEDEIQTFSDTSETVCDPDSGIPDHVVLAACKILLLVRSAVDGGAPHRHIICC